MSYSPYQTTPQNNPSAADEDEIDLRQVARALGLEPWLLGVGQFHLHLLLTGCSGASFGRGSNSLPEAFDQGKHGVNPYSWSCNFIENCCSGT